MYLNTNNNGRIKQFSILSGYRNAKGEVYLAEGNYITGGKGSTVINRHINFQKIENGAVEEVMIDVTGLESVIESNQAGKNFSVSGEEWTILSESELEKVLAKTYSRS